MASAAKTTKTKRGNRDAKLQKVRTKKSRRKLTKLKAQGRSAQIK